MRRLLSRLLDCLVGPKRYELVLTAIGQHDAVSSSQWFRTRRTADRYRVAGNSVLNRSYHAGRARAVAYGYDPDQVPVYTQRLVDHGADNRQGVAR